ncbi:hypothetical protein Taro_004227 [Colocasia esculenta]|uniref:Uncharacterized protein n=1 Tax=Colocasia esculenta TaxID=4460 RepID=A0A843TPC8_COLES|nr:hypothetical protein [Colocasia esculenta]
MSTVAVAMERFPDRVAVAVFLAAFVGDVFSKSSIPEEDLTLGKALIRAGSYFVDDLATETPFSQKGYGSVKKVYIMCDEDLLVTIDQVPAVAGLAANFLMDEVLKMQEELFL